MGFLEKLGFRNPEEIAQQKEKEKTEQYLHSLLDQYRINSIQLRNAPEKVMGQGHLVDSHRIYELENSLKNLKPIIIETALKLGKDGNELITDIEGNLNQSPEESKAA